MPDLIEAFVYVFLIFSLYMWLTEDHSCKIPDILFCPSSSSPGKPGAQRARRAPGKNNRYD